MREWLIYYSIFIAAAALIIALAVSKLKVKSPVRLLALILVLIVSPVIISLIVTAYLNPLPEVMVPDLVGRSFSEANAIIENTELNLEIETQAGASYIISNQRPEAGRIVKAGRTIYITLGEKMPQTETPPGSFEAEQFLEEAISNEAE